jgi:hypothetical protein
MNSIMQNRNSGRSRKATVVNPAAAALRGLAMTAVSVQAQQALGVPLAGKNNLSFSVTELSRDGVSSDETAVYGGIYARRLNSENSPVQFSVIVRTAVRALEKVSSEGIVDAGALLAATYRVNAFSITGATGGTAVVWGKETTNDHQFDRGRLVARAPITTGVAYDFRVGSATIAPFVSYTAAYSKERNFQGDEWVSTHKGWRYSNSSGASVRFQKTVLTLSQISRERGMPNRNRVLFTAGMTW